MLQMLKDRVAIRPLADPDKIGSIYIPDTAKRKSDQGVIIYRGPEVKELKVGDHVLFPAYSGTKITVVGEGMYYVMPEEEVSAVLGEGERVFTMQEIEIALDHVYDIQSDKDSLVWDYVQSVLDLFSNADVRALEV